MYSEKLENFIEAIIADGIITDKEQQVLHKLAAAEGVDLDEIDIVVESRLYKMLNSSPVSRPQGASAGPPPIPGANSSRMTNGSMCTPPPPPPAPSASNAKAPAPPPAPFQRKQSDNSMGTLDKCPNCGCVVEAGIPRCVECGYAFRNINANSAVEKFSILLREAETMNLTRRGIFDISGSDDSYRRAQIVRTTIEDFPVPSGKEDLIEFILFLEPKTTGSMFKNPYKEHYKTKYEECIKKAQFFFGDDPDIQKLFENTNENTNEKKGGFLGRFRKK